MVKAINHLRALPDRGKAMGENARQRIASHYTLATFSTTITTGIKNRMMKIAYLDPYPVPGFACGFIAKYCKTLMRLPCRCTSDA